jgi:hypothetical protein
MGVQVATGREVGPQQAFQESEGSGQPGRTGEISELLAGECRHHDPGTVRGGEVAGEAATPVVRCAGRLGLGALATSV